MNSSDFRLVRLIPVTGTGSFSGGGGSYWDSAGVLQTAPANTLRMSYDPSDLSKAPFALIEPEARNSIRNNTMAGAVVGAPGTVPTYWGVYSTLGLSMAIIGAGSEGGIEYVDLRIYGTTTGAWAVAHTFFEAIGSPQAASGEVWVQSLFLKIISGSTAGLDFRLNPEEKNASGNTWVRDNHSSPLSLASSGTLAQNRHSHSATLAGVGTGSIRPYLYCAVQAAGVVVDLTLRIGLPQLERDRITSPIKTTNGAVTRAADVVGPGAGLVYSNVPITEPLWASGTYALGARVRDAAFLTYESQVANNTAALTDKTKWLPLGATNQRKAFDKAVNSQTSAPGLVAFAVKPGSVATTLMLLNMEGASVTVSQSDSGYVKTQSLVSHEVDNWFDFYYEEPVRAGDAVFTDIPPYPDSMLTVAIDNGPLEAKIGACLVGKPLTLGKVTASFSAGVLSYSTSTADTFGNIAMVKRYNAPRMNFDVMIPSGSEDFTYRVLREYTDTEIGVIVGDRFGMGIGYGFLGQWDVPKSGSGRTAPIEFKGLV